MVASAASSNTPASKRAGMPFATLRRTYSQYNQPSTTSHGPISSRATKRAIEEVLIRRLAQRSQRGARALDRGIALGEIGKLHAGRQCRVVVQEHEPGNVEGCKRPVGAFGR